jgi:SAM-dependent methyltransferase
MDTLETQRTFWNSWNADHREDGVGEISRRQAEVIVGWLSEQERRNLDILEVGCGTGWFCPQLSRFGRVTATDLSDEVLRRAQARWPGVGFLAGDFATLPLKEGTFDVVVSLEVLSHVADQDAFIARIHRLLKPGGLLLLATQNRSVLSMHCDIAEPRPGQLRNWVDHWQLSALLRPYFSVERLVSVTPIAHHGRRRILTSSRLNALLRPFVGNGWRNFLERRGWGWTLIVRARKRG